MRWFALLVGAVTAVVACASPLRAQYMQLPDKIDADGVTNPSIATSLPKSEWRKRLSDQGVTFLFNYTNDTLSNVSGGQRTGTVNQGKLETIINVDLEKIAGLQGLSFYTNNFVIHNSGRFRRDYIGGINTIAAIEANRTVRLSELWLEQKFAGDKATFRFGQLAVDSEFFYSDASQMFLQSDWPTITAQNLPSGAAAYPLATPGLRLKVDPNKHATFMLAMFNGDPAGPGPANEEPDLRNRYGLNFRMRDPPMFIGEAQVRWNYDKDDKGLATQIKLGGWQHTGKFADQRFADDGRLLADPASSGNPLMHRGDWGIYGVIDQQLYRLPGRGKDYGINVFAMGSFSPGDRAQIQSYFSGGIVFAGLISQRPDDRFGLSYIYARYSNDLAAFDRDMIAFGTPGFVRDYEANLEFTYMAQIVPGWVVMPTLQYVWHPSGQAGRDAKVVGVRTMLRF